MSDIDHKYGFSRLASSLGGRVPGQKCPEKTESIERPLRLKTVFHAVKRFLLQAGVYRFTSMGSPMATALLRDLAPETTMFMRSSFESERARYLRNSSSDMRPWTKRLYFL